MLCERCHRWFTGGRPLWATHKGGYRYGECDQCGRLEHTAPCWDWQARMSRAEELLSQLVDAECEPVVFWMPEHGATVEIWGAADDSGSQRRTFFKGSTISEAAKAALREVNR